MRRIRDHLTYANVMVTILAFIVLGGGAYAAFRLPKNSVRSKNIVNGQVKRPDLADHSINGGNVKDDSLTGNDVRESSLGPVPMASVADNADSLDNLDSTAFGYGITSVSYDPNEAATEFVP